ncbi:MAG: aspartate carbamoyltransferase catalytic subunit [Firmicutes bacterium]|nr:aspartate carbamoyltransferase catalytic subunit [Bacillota bacterium]
MKRKDLLGLRDISADEIMTILDMGKEMRARLDANEAGTELKGKTVATLFYENSTRTRVSFEKAARCLGAQTTGITAQASSVQKGESLIDTGKTLQSLLTDAIVIRHPSSGAPHFLAKNIDIPVINGGDGTNEHPTQALLDMLTVYRAFGDFRGLKVVIAGDIKHSRVARSNIWGLKKLGAEITLVAPETLLPAASSRLGCEVSYNLEEAVCGANVIIALRLQLERQTAGLFPSAAEYHRYYGITDRILHKADAGVLLMHPGPINRGLEVSGAAADGECSVILDQVTNGVAVRMAVLKLLCAAAY